MEKRERARLVYWNWVAFKQRHATNKWIRQCGSLCCAVIKTTSTKNGLWHHRCSFSLDSFGRPFARSLSPPARGYCIHLLPARIISESNKIFVAYNVSRHFSVHFLHSFLPKREHKNDSISLICERQVNDNAYQSGLRLSLRFSNELSRTMFVTGSIIDLFQLTWYSNFFAEIKMTHQTKIWFRHINIFECCWEGDELIGIRQKMIMSSNIVYKRFGSFCIQSSSSELKNFGRKKFNGILVCFIIWWVNNNNCPTPFHAAISIRLTQENSNWQLIEWTKNRCSQFDKDEVPAARLINEKNQHWFWWAEQIHDAVFN